LTHLLDLTLPDLPANLALDEALLLSAEAGGPEVLRFWEWPSQAVIIGAGGKWQVEADVSGCARDDVPILRRSSGGGAVLLGPGCLLFSLILPFERHAALADLHASYRFILGTIAEALTPLAPGIAQAGISDLAVAGRKCSGNAQQRKRTHLLHHGTLLCSLDVANLPRYLAHPPREPNYRGRRSHLDFVGNLAVPVDQVKQVMCNAWKARDALAAWPEGLTSQLIKEKYARADWHQRR
jgi:lipoate-protein ligase A